MSDVELLVVGAGPAGMAAAVEASAAGAEVLVLDEQPAPGGQVWRAVEAAAASRGELLGADYTAGLETVRAFRESGARYQGGATVWRVDADGTVCVSAGGRAQRLSAARLILATGALERPVPVPGWTLPGVLTAGAAQILMKSAGVVPARAVLAGGGPLLYLVAQQLIRAGRSPLALLETQRTGDYARSLLALGGALRGWRALASGAGMLADIRRAGVPRYRAVHGLAIDGEDAVRAVEFEHGGRRRRIECGSVLLHQGVVPNTQATRALRLEHRWDQRQRCFQPRVDAWGATGIDGLYVAGDGAGIGGAAAAALRGRLAALHALQALGRLAGERRDTAAAPLRARLAAELAVRPFLDLLYSPPAELLRPPADATPVCRCEEVSAGDIRRYARLGCRGPNQAKAFGRPGMGPCQGRYCGLTVSELLVEASGRAPADVGYFRLRQPLKPVTLGELAGMDGTDPLG